LSYFREKKEEKNFLELLAFLIYKASPQKNGEAKSIEAGGEGSYHFHADTFVRSVDLS